MPACYAGKQNNSCLVSVYFDWCYFLIIFILHFYDIIINLFIKLTNPLQFLRKPQFGKPWNNVMLNSLYVNKWNIFSFNEINALD